MLEAVVIRSVPSEFAEADVDRRLELRGQARKRRELSVLQIGLGDRTLGVGGVGRGPVGRRPRRFERCGLVADTGIIVGNLATGDLVARLLQLRIRLGDLRQHIGRLTVGGDAFDGHRLPQLMFKSVS
jgi:hypothetical protein